MRILIIGWPKTGKTTLAKKMAAELNLEHRCTDPQKLCDPGVTGIPDSLDWSGGSAYVVEKLFGRPNSIIEGVAIPRALRKWKESNPNKPLPFDRIIHLKTVHTDLVKGQVAMGKGIDTVLRGILPWMPKIEVQL